MMTTISSSATAPLRINTTLQSFTSPKSPSTTMVNIISSPMSAPVSAVSSNDSTVTGNSLTPTGPAASSSVVPTATLRIAAPELAPHLRGVKPPTPPLTAFPISVTMLSRRGKGIATLRTFPPHTAIFTEFPLLSKPAHVPLAHLLARVGSDVRDDFWALYNRHSLWSPADTRPDTVIEQIWASNCLSNESGEVVFANYARLNHDCCPNAKIQLYEGGPYGLVDKIKVIAKRAIGPGEEVTLDYLEDVVGAGGYSGSNSLDVRERRQLLAREWGFWCTCRKCTVEEYWANKQDQKMAEEERIRLKAEADEERRMQLYHH